MLLSFEAEQATVLVPPMEVLPDATASDGGCIHTTVIYEGTASYAFTVPVAADYVVYGRIIGPTTGSDSFFVSMDGAAEDVYDIAGVAGHSAVWQWTRVNGRGDGGTPATIDPRVFPLQPGPHTLLVRGRELGSLLDRLVISNDPGLVLAP